MKHANGHLYSFDQLQSFVDGTLDKALSGQIEQHLASCPECRATIAKLRALETKVPQALPTNAPQWYFDTFGSRISARITARREAPRAKRAWFAWWGLVPAAAAAVLALLIVLNPEHGARQRSQRDYRPAPGTVTPARPEVAERTVAPAAPSSPAAKPTDNLALQKEHQQRPEEEMTLAAKDEAAAPALRASRGTSSRAAPAPAVAMGGIAEMKSKRQAEPSPAPSEQPASCAPLTVNQLEVIVIHVPGGTAKCPAPSIATAIEIVIPADCRSTN